MGQQAGFVAALLSLACFGSFAVPMRLKSLMHARISPLVFVHYKAVSLFVCSLLLVAVARRARLSVLGLLTAPMSVANTMLCYIAVQRAGLVLSQPVWSISDVLTSFVVGTVFLQEKVTNIVLATVAIALIMAGMAMLLPQAGGGDLNCKAGYTELATVPTAWSNATSHTTWDG